MQGVISEVFPEKADNFDRDTGKNFFQKARESRVSCYFSPSPGPTPFLQESIGADRHERLETDSVPRIDRNDRRE